MSIKTDQTELETKIIRYRALARLTADDLPHNRARRRNGTRVA